MRRASSTCPAQRTRSVEVRAEKPGLHTHMLTGLWAHGWGLGLGRRA